MITRNTCGLCGLPISPDVDLEDDDGQHYHRACNVVSASTLYRAALTRIAELEAKTEHDEDNLEGLQHALVRANQQYTQAEAELAKADTFIELLKGMVEQMEGDEFDGGYDLDDLLKRVRDA